MEDDRTSDIELPTLNENNNENENMKNTTEEPEAEELPLWQLLMDRSQLVMTIIGLIANLGTSITLIKNGQVRHCFFSSE